MSRDGSSSTSPGPIVDAHLHQWDLRDGEPSWLVHADPDSVADAVARRYPVYDAAAYGESLGLSVAAAVLVESEWSPAASVAETRWLSSTRRTFDIPTVIVGYARLEDPDVERTLTRYAEDDAVRGVRQILAWSTYPSEMDVRDAMAVPAWRRGFALLEHLDLSFDLSVDPLQLDSAADLASAFPRTPIVLDHLGSPGSGRDEREAWEDGIRRLADHPNVASKVSGLSSPNRTIDEVVELIEIALDAFGCERTMFGSNLPVEHVLGSFPVMLAAAERAIASRGAHDRVRFWSGTAAEFYRIDLATDAAVSGAGPSNP